MPRVFGLVAITTLVATALSTLAETGVWVAIVRKGSSVDGDWLDQMWTLQAVRGVILICSRWYWCRSLPGPMAIPN